MKKQSAAGSKRSKALPPYKNPKLPSAQRVKDLLSRMTIEEKAAQMVCVWREKADKLVDEEGNFDYAKAKAAFCVSARSTPRFRPVSKMERGFAFPAQARSASSVAPPGIYT